MDWLQNIFLGGADSGEDSSAKPSAALNGIIKVLGAALLGYVIVGATAAPGPSPAQVAAQAPAQRNAGNTPIEVLKKEMDQIGNGTISRERGIELFNSQMAAGAEDAARAPGDDVVMAARVGTTPDVIQRMRKSFREAGVSSVGFDQLLYGIARQMNE
jgi:hypothetical protein